MPRNLSGVYTLPAGNPVVPGTTIDANWANSTLSDMANEITNSLSRTGAGGMLAPFRIDDGNVTGPGLAFLNETNTGYYRLAAGSTAFSVLGVNTLQMNTTSVTVPSNRTLNAQGNALVGGTLGVTGVAAFGSTLAVTGAITALGGVLGNITAASGTSSFNDVTISGSLDMVAGSSATITGLSNPTNASDAANKGYVDTQDALKLNLTGGTMSGNLAMGNNLITGLGTAVSGGDATNKTYVDGQVVTRLPLAGGTMSGAIAMSTNKITGLGTPTADTDAATKAYVDSVAQGLDVKGSVRAATTGNITLSGTQTIDGVAIGAGDRVLVKDQSTAANNGIYVAAAGAWSRAADADTWAELVGAFVFVEDGTTNDNSGWVCTSPPGGTLGVTAVTFEQFSGAGQINAGTGMTKTGNTLNVNTASSSRIVVGADEIDLAQTGVTAGTYKSVTVDLYGRVTAGTNPTTLAGYGITDAYTQTQTDTLLNGKLSLTGGTMSGALAMGTSKITGLGNPTNAQDAATKTYVDTADALKLNLTGGTMSGALAMGTNRITGLGDPVNAQDAATKNYIDTIFGSTTSAAASAAAAASSASSASSSASSASSSASSASSSASTASTALFNFRAQYLGPLASDPSVDGNGNPVSTGDLYFNTTASETRVYNGSAWVAAYVPTAGYALLAAANVFTNNQTITVNTSNDALKITQTGSGNALYIEDVAADATPFVVSSTGAVGIGTTTPDNVTSAGIALVSNDGFYPQVVNRNKTNDTTASYLVFDKDRAGAIVQNGDGLGNIVWRSFDGTNYLQSAAIIAYSDAAPGTNDVPGRLTFLTTADGAAAPTERFRIASNGAWGLAGANYGTSGQVLTSNGSGSAPTWQNAGGGGSAATPTALGTVYGKTDLGSPFNTFGGYQTGTAVTSGYTLTGFGWNSLLNATSANSCAAFGDQSLKALTTGTENTAIGSRAMILTTTGSFNTAVGRQALENNTTANNNTAVGHQAAYANTTGSNLTAVGRVALYANTTGASNSALGYGALNANTTGNYNTAVGEFSLVSNTTASNNTAVGYQALYSNTTGSSNTSIGYLAGRNNATGTLNTAVGSGVLQSNTGTANTGVGVDVCRVTTGSYNTGVGSYDNGGYSPLWSNTSGQYNIGIGNGALGRNTTASQNIAIGYQAMSNNTTGENNTAVGTLALASKTTGDNNTAVGFSALYSASTSSSNTAVGYYALYGNTTGYYNVSVGRESSRSMTSGYQNTAVGDFALWSNTTGEQNTAIGFQAAYNSTGGYSTVVGYQAGYYNTTGYVNAFGYRALYNNTTATVNIAFGPQALFYTTTGDYNTAVGRDALLSNTTASYSTAVGYQAGYSNTTGAGNTTIGYSTAYYLTTGQYNTAIGYTAGSGWGGTYLTTGSGNTYVGFGSSPSSSSVQSELMVAASSTYALNGKGSNTGFIAVYNNGSYGGIYQGNNSSSWSTTSDRRLKKNIVDNNEGIDIISQIRVRNFEYRLPEEVDPELSPKSAVDIKGVQLGVIAQELQQVCPDCVKEESTGVLSVDSDNVFWHMVNAIKQLNAKVEALQAEITTLKGA